MSGVAGKGRRRVSERSPLACAPTLRCLGGDITTDDETGSSASTGRKQYPNFVEVACPRTLVSWLARLRSRQPGAKHHGRQTDSELLQYGDLNRINKPQQRRDCLADWPAKHDKKVIEVAAEPLDGSKRICVQYVAFAELLGDNRAVLCSVRLDMEVCCKSVPYSEKYAS